MFVAKTIHHLPDEMLMKLKPRIRSGLAVLVAYFLILNAFSHSEDWKAIAALLAYSVIQLLDNLLRNGPSAETTKKYANSV